MPLCVQRAACCRQYQGFATVIHHKGLKNKVNCYCTQNDIYYCGTEKQTRGKEENQGFGKQVDERGGTGYNIQVKRKSKGEWTMDHFQDIRAALQERNLDAMMLTNEANRLYATGFHSTDTDGLALVMVTSLLLQ